MVALVNAFSGRTRRRRNIREVDGWQCLRIVATIDDKIAGGFQILWRQTRLGRIGYVTKGPAVVPEVKSLVDRLVVVMRDQSRENKILALVVQPPDESQITSDALGRCGFIPGGTSWPRRPA